MKKKHEWRNKGRCHYVCKICGEKTVKHEWEEDFEDSDVPVARFLKCKGCGKLKDNAKGPNRPMTEDTPKLIVGMLQEFEERQDVCSYIQGDHGERIWFDFPDKIVWALAQVYDRSEEQIEYFLKAANLL